jgi:DNA-binding NarL/FixJ family response regulator
VGVILAEKMKKGVTASTGGDGRVQKLTPREIEVINLLAYGFSYAQIAEQLGVTLNTLKTHIKRAYSKLKVHNRTQAVLVARQHDFL